MKPSGRCRQVKNGLLIVEEFLTIRCWYLRLRREERNTECTNNCADCGSDHFAPHCPSPWWSDRAPSTRLDPTKDYPKTQSLLKVGSACSGLRREVVAPGHPSSRLLTGAPGGWPALATRAPDAARCGARPEQRAARTTCAPTPPWPNAFRALESGLTILTQTRER